MSDILKEAIADAKAVRETALQNAKMALQEAFTPQLKSMLSAKLKEDDMDDEDDVAMDDEMGDEEEEEVPAEYADTDEMADYSEDEMEDEEMGGEEDMGDEEMGDEEGEEDMESESLELEDIIRELEDELSADGEEEGEEEVDETIEVNGVRYAPIREGEDKEDEEEIDEIQKKGRPGYLKKGEADPDTAASAGDSVNESNEEYEISDTLFEEDEDDDDDEEVDEGKTPSVSSNIGKGGNPDTNYAPTEDPGKNKISEIVTELAEYKEAVHFLKDKLHEVNILNAKLLFTNKLFKEYALDNNQKLKVVETFDRAQSTREIKLVYSTLAEQFTDNSNIINRKSITESASAKSGSTKPSKGSRKVISEESQVANRFKKLAGIL